jgi:hypothetical protein
MTPVDGAATGRERVVAAYKGGFADRVPAYPIAGSFAGCLDRTLGPGVSKRTARAAARGGGNRSPRR